MENDETIVAQATPLGYGGVGIVRVSGKQVSNIAKLILHKLPKPRQATYGAFYVDNQEIDEGIAIYFPAPNSYTGEDVLELQAHGSSYVLNTLVRYINEQNNLRLAEPGEFTKRAFLNSKLDLVQAEAVADLISATSEKAARAALASMQGKFSNIVNNIQEQITKLRIYVEAALDFSEEEIAFFQTQEFYKKFKQSMQT